jgi:hypothetical protein
MKKALDWWYNTLTEAGRANFPIPEDNDDIYAYYTNPAEHCIESTHRY